MGQTVSAATSAGSAPSPQQDVSWWLKFLSRASGTVGGLLAMVLGLWACVTLTAICLAAGMIQIFLGFMVVIFEAPCCCTFVDFADKLSRFSEERPPWQKAMMYGLFSVIPVAMCVEVSTIVGNLFVFVSAVLYGVISLGRKADRETMMMRAAASVDSMKVDLVDAERQPTAFS